MSGSVHDSAQADKDVGIPDASAHDVEQAVAVDGMTLFTEDMVSSSYDEDNRGVGWGSLTCGVSDYSVSADSVNLKVLSTYQMIAEGKMVVVLDAPQSSEPKILKASPSHLILACHALSLASIQGLTSGDVGSKQFRQNAAANAQAVTPVCSHPFFSIYECSVCTEKTCPNRTPAPPRCKADF